MASTERFRERARQVLLTPAVLGVAAMSLALTSAFVGVLAFASGATPDVQSRLAYYVFAMAVVFVVGVIRLDTRDRSGVAVLSSVVAVSVVAFAIVLLAGEGLVYAVQHPGEVLTTQLILYFVAAALICTGLGIWGYHHWREFAAGRGAGRR